MTNRFLHSLFYKISFPQLKEHTWHSNTVPEPRKLLLKSIYLPVLIYPPAESCVFKNEFQFWSFTYVYMYIYTLQQPNKKWWLAQVSVLGLSIFCQNLVCYCMLVLGEFAFIPNNICMLQFFFSYVQWLDHTFLPLYFCKIYCTTRITWSPPCSQEDGRKRTTFAKGQTLFCMFLCWFGKVCLNLRFSFCKMEMMLPMQYKFCWFM